MKRTFLITLFIFVTNSIFAEDTKGVVTVNALRMRATPDLNGQQVLLLEKGTIVTILERSKNMTKVGDTEDNWYKAQHAGKTGWLFAAFVTKDFHCVDDRCGTITWASEVPSEVDEFPVMRMITLFDKSKKSEKYFKTTPESSDYFFSRNLKYLAVDAGTDVVGGIIFYSTQNGKKVHSATYGPREFKWEGNKVKYNHVLCYDDGYVLCEEEIFDDGKVIKTGKYVKSGYHGGMDTGGCAKFKDLLRKVK